MQLQGPLQHTNKGHSCIHFSWRLTSLTQTSRCREGPLSSLEAGSWHGQSIKLSTIQTSIPDYWAVCMTSTINITIIQLTRVSTINSCYRCDYKWMKLIVRHKNSHYGIMEINSMNFQGFDQTLYSNENQTIGYTKPWSCLAHRKWCQRFADSVAKKKLSTHVNIQALYRSIDRSPDRIF